MIRRVKVLLLILPVSGVLGCGPELSDEELGRVVFEVPEIPAGYEPYELPDLTASPGGESDGVESLEPASEAPEDLDESAADPGDAAQEADAPETEAGAAVESAQSAAPPADRTPAGGTGPSGE